MPDAEQLVLAARVRMLRRSLEAVRDSLIVVEQERKVMRDLLPNILEQTFAKLNEVDAAAERLRKLVELDPFYDDRVSTETAGIRVQTEEIRAHLRRVRKGARSFGGLQRDTETALQEDFLRGIEDQIEAATSLLDGVTDAATPAEIQAAWRRQRTLFLDSQQFFAEYVELLTGLALRDSGFDQGVSEIADALIRRGMAGWYSLTIPAHKPPDAPTRARFIHLGFPEWTPWALPLAAYDVGRMELEKGALAAFLDAAAKEGLRRADLEAALADAIATYLVGPAYAWATVAIRFDPGTGYPERVAANRRLALMLAALRSHDDPERPTERAFSTVADDLLEVWEVTLREVGEATPTDKERADAGREMTDAEIESAIRALRGYLPRAMRADDWQQVTELADELRREGEIEPVDDLRIVLNAAWRVRIDDQLDKSGDDSPLRALGERARGLLRDGARAVADEAGGTGHGRRAPAVQR